jgi:hypothetical protein
MASGPVRRPFGWSSGYTLDVDMTPDSKLDLDDLEPDLANLESDPEKRCQGMRVDSPLVSTRLK